MTAEPVIAVDWGTTNRRAWLIEHGAVAAEHRDDRGVRAVAPGSYPTEVAALRARFGDHPVIAAGMVGSTRGWIETPYVPCPVGAEQLAAGLIDVGGRVAIVPGVSQDDDRAADVMRGEEVQFLGAVRAGLAPPDALMLQPGTHSKWAWIERGKIIRFATAMTGELYQLLRERSVLADMMTAPADAGSAAFRDGVERGAGARDLTAVLFGVRAATLLGRRSVEAGSSYASGLLIGAEVASRDVAGGGEISLLADGALAALYRQAIVMLGGRVRSVDSKAAFVAGILAIEEMRR